MGNLAPLITIAQLINARSVNSSIAAIDLEQEAKSIVKTRLVPSMETLRAAEWGWEANVIEVLLHNSLAAELPAQSWSYHLEQAAAKYAQITIFLFTHAKSLYLGRWVLPNTQEIGSRRPQSTRVSSTIPITPYACYKSFCVV